MPSLPRVDYVGAIEIVDDLESAPRIPGRVPAVVTPEGYLDCQALTARDGLLTYSDGVRSWVEYRPREELEGTLDGWAAVPVCDGHPPEMVSAATWARYARGHGLGPPEIVDVDGVAFTLQRLRFADSDLVAKVRSGEQPQLSIGFVSDVVPIADWKGTAPEGTEAVQTAIGPNHHASVARGRAGPFVRPLLDGEAVPVCWPGLASGYVPHPTTITTMTNPTNASAKPAGTKPKGDELGNPTELVEVMGPDGKPYKLPSWAAAALQQAKPAAPPPAMSPPVPPAAPADAMTSAAAPPMRKPEEQPMDSADAMRAKLRAKLERRAGRLGLTDAAIDDAIRLGTLEQVVDSAARELVAKRMPHAVEVAKAQRGDALFALVDAALAAPQAQPTAGEPTPARGNPWASGDQQPTNVAPRKDAVDSVVEKFLAAQGYN